MAGKTLTAMISLAGKVDASLQRAINQASKEAAGLQKKFAQTGVAAAKMAGKAALAVGAAAGAAALTIGKQALDSYATYEQMAGGVETLFGNAGMGVEDYAASVGKSVDQVQADWDRNNRAQQTVMQNAQSAWSQAGVSANDYMRQATSFSASLIQSLGGDTEAAARYTDMAIKDMSDNASKMGTDLGTLQNTYQSLMRGNYAMLDSLQLGYGGTKSELERLVADASQLTGKALDPTKFSDIVEAIHAVQEKMHITGSTAAEAASTIEGSVGSMKAAWSNWLTGLGDENADMGALTQNLVTAIGNVASNIGPRIVQIGQSMVQYLPEALSGLGTALGPILTEALVGAWNVATQAFAAVGLQLPQIDASAVQGLFQTLSDAFSQVMAAVGPPLQMFINTVLPPLMSALQGLIPLISTIVSVVLPPIIGYITPIIGLLMTIISAILPPLTSLIQFLSPVIQILVTAIMMWFTATVQVTAPLQAIANAVLPRLSAAITTVGGPIGSFVGWLQSLWSAAQPVVSVLSSVAGAIMNVVNAAAQIGGTVLGAAGSAIGSMLGFAKGGFTYGPSLAGEDPNYPTEAVISFNPAYRAQNVRYWQAAGRKLGAYGSARAAAGGASAAAGGSVVNLGGVTFSPNVVVRGNASKEDIIAAIRQSEGEFVDFVMDALARRTEVAYA